MTQSQPLRVEHPKHGSFGTARTLNSGLWFVNSPDIEYHILARLAQYTKKYEVPIYAFVFSGSHYHPLAKFPKCNRAQFYRDLNARAAEIVRNYNPDFPGGPLFERRYSEQALPLDQDVEDRFFYCALQPVSAGLCQRISDYPGYNSFNDAICGIKRKYKIVDWSRYNAAKKHNRHVNRADYTTEHELEYARLPGYEEMPREEYRTLMLKKLEERRQKLVNEQLQKNPNHYYRTKEELRKVVPGTLAKSPKKSTRTDRRPLVLSTSPEAKQRYLDWYFMIYTEYKRSAEKYFKGEQEVTFPPGTYRPPGLVHPYPT